MLGGQRHLLQARAHLAVVADALQGDGRHAHDAVHGRAYLVRHARQELGLGQARLLGLGERALGAILLLGQQARVAPGHPVVEEEYQQYEKQHGRAHDGGVRGDSAAEVADVALDDAVGHDGAQVPFRMSERIEVQVLAAAVEHDGHVDGAAAREDRADPLLLATAPDEGAPLVYQGEQALARIQPAVAVAHHAHAVAVYHDGAREAVEQREVEAVAHAQGAEPADGGHDRVVAAAQRLDVVHQHDLVVVQHDPAPLRIVVRGQLAAVPVAGTHLAVCGDELAGGGPHGEKGVVVVACLGLQVVHRLLPAFGSGHLQPARHRLELAELVLHARIEVEDQLLAQLAQIHFAHVRDDVVGGLARGDDGVGQQQRHGHGHRHHSHRRAPATRNARSC